MIKGGHSTDRQAIDYLLTDNGRFEIATERLENAEKHGSGCVLSAAITAELANGKPLLEACQLAKKYVFQVLNSNSNKLGYHH